MVRDVYPGKAFDIKEGDTVKITAQGTVRRETVLTASYYTEGGWYIELVDPTYGYCYYKQSYDGGKIELV